jgi:hypothetical protein
MVVPMAGVMAVTAIISAAVTVAVISVIIRSVTVVAAVIRTDYHRGTIIASIAVAVIPARISPWGAICRRRGRIDGWSDCHPRKRDRWQRKTKGEVDSSGSRD